MLRLIARRRLHHSNFLRLVEFRSELILRFIVGYGGIFLVSAAVAVLIDVAGADDDADCAYDARNDNANRA